MVGNTQTKTTKTTTNTWITQDDDVDVKIHPAAYEC